MTMLPFALCDSCTRKTAPDRCAAFPAGIPAEILMNLVDHRQPVEGDHGLQFKEDPKHNENLAIAVQILERASAAT
jgi:hypothetical protein